MQIKYSWIHVSTPEATNVLLASIPFFPALTLNVSLRPGRASRAQTLCMHTDKPINRPFIPIIHFRVMSDSMWADCSNNISFRPSLRNVCTSTATHTLYKNVSLFQLPRVHNTNIFKVLCDKYTLPFPPVSGGYGALIFSGPKSSWKNVFHFL